jgi:hypothetical protein
VGRVGRIHAISNAGRDPAIALTLEELDAAGQGSFHQVVLRGADAIMALEAGLRSRDLIIVALEGLTARAYLDGPPGQGRPVGYLESRGRDPFVLDRPGPQDGLEEEKR